jgi:hypothetical protein
MLSMFVGHNTVGFASKRVAPRTSLLWLIPFWAAWIDRHREARS